MSNKVFGKYFTVKVECDASFGTQALSTREYNTGIENKLRGKPEPETNLLIL